MKTNRRLTGSRAIAIATLAVWSLPAFSAVDLDTAATLVFGPQSSSGGVGSATIAFQSSDGSNTLTATINNNSPITTTSGGLNAPALVGFGFGLEGEVLPYTWSLYAYTIANPSVYTDITSHWTLSDANGIAGLVLEYTPCVEGSTDQCGGVDDALYNPLLGSTFSPAGGSGYFTTAVLTMVFSAGSGDIRLDNTTMTNVEGSDCYSFVRMQNVGTGGAGSLKMCGTVKKPDDPGQIPEPASLALMGIGLLGFGVLRGRRTS